MALRHAFILAGSLWETARFFIVISLLAQVFRSAPGGIPWLLLGGSGNLLVGVGGILLSLFPEKYGELIGLLRLGKVLAVFSFFLLVASGAAGISAGIELLRLGPFSFTEGAVLLAIFVLDVLFLIALMAWRRGNGSPFSAVAH
jgi:hypothetical protein